MTFRHRHGTAIFSRGMLTSQNSNIKSFKYFYENTKSNDLIGKNNTDYDQTKLTIEDGAFHESQYKSMQTLRLYGSFENQDILVQMLEKFSNLKYLALSHLIGDCESIRFLKSKLLQNGSTTNVLEYVLHDHDKVFPMNDTTRLEEREYRIISTSKRTLTDRKDSYYIC